ncbi:MAG: gamma carbonic anhydrase family protein [Proteobacteria bacterium]|nr:gamma carbonic anhydrase family protein [Pseudomonadota bacterium]
MNIYQLGDKKPHLPPVSEYWIAPNAIVVGDVILQKNASVWFGAVVRGDNDPITIGENTNVQDGSVLHSDVGLPLNIGRDVTIGHMAMVHSCDIGDQSLIGIGAVILARAKIGKNSIVGAGALVPEGKEYPDGVLLVGSPARVVRELTPEQIGFLKASADHYVANWKRYATDLKPA